MLMVIMLVDVVLNVLFNWMFIWGYLGVLVLGFIGLGVVMLIV